MDDDTFLEHGFYAVGGIWKHPPRRFYHRDCDGEWTQIEQGVYLLFQSDIELLNDGEALAETQ